MYNPHNNNESPTWVNEANVGLGSIPKLQNNHDANDSIANKRKQGELMGSNNTKIKYLKIEDKIYRVTELHLFYLSLEAEETDLSVEDVPQEELFGISDFNDFKIRLVNNKGEAEIVDIAKWNRGRA